MFLSALVGTVADQSLRFAMHFSYVCKVHTSVVIRRERSIVRSPLIVVLSVATLGSVAELRESAPGVVAGVGCIHEMEQHFTLYWLHCME